MQFVDPSCVDIQGLTHPHDVAVDTVDHVVYVGELNPPKVWKFTMDKAIYGMYLVKKFTMDQSYRFTKALTQIKLTQLVLIVLTAVSV